MLLFVLWHGIQQFKTLQREPVAATVYKPFVREGVFATSHFLIIRYQQPQHGEQFACIVATKQLLADLPPTTPLTVCYSPDKPRSALLSNEPALSEAFAFGIVLFGFLTFNGLVAQRQLR
ncbi:hypothetical protein MON38_18020 [Hymenobacter sp. DH14]|uniref:DUF3592 domain-containing protein n=1 Tax=Hymenobacter cyanobacteriorum TaxID=2926463 RepID=A0A9X2AJX2_9BACT|nr:hypothetical protein [Hymenobacter cyanobacteriorum]MCI1189324.1 hypothetical protein [Hymenobacter cyanobacteriorum]